MSKKKGTKILFGTRELQRMNAYKGASMPLCPECGAPIDTRSEYARIRNTETKFKPVTYHPACLMVRKSRPQQSEAQP